MAHHVVCVLRQSRVGEPQRQVDRLWHWGSVGINL